MLKLFIAFKCSSYHHNAIKDILVKKLWLEVYGEHNCIIQNISKYLFDNLFTCQKYS